MRPSPLTTPLAQPLRHTRRPDEPPAGLRVPRRWDQVPVRDRVLLSLLLHPDEGRSLPRAG